MNVKKFLRLHISKVSDQEEVNMKLKIMKLSVAIFNNLIKYFNVLNDEIDKVNIKLSEHCNDLSEYYYTHSEEDISNQINKSKYEYEYYKEHPEEIPDNEEIKEYSIIDEINDAILLYDEQRMLSLFDKINSDDQNIKKFLDSPDVSFIFDESKKLKRAYKKSMEKNMS